MNQDVNGWPVSFLDKSDRRLIGNASKRYEQNIVRVDMANIY